MATSTERESSGEVKLEVQHAQAPAAAATVESEADSTARHSHSRGLLAIGLFKLSKAIFFFAVGMGALHLIHKNIGDLFLRVGSIFHFDPEGQFMSMLEDKADLISGHELRQISLATCGYAILSLVEGTGLMLEKTWAEYLTLSLTIAGLPWELFEIARRPTSSRVGLLAINLVVLAYLLWYLRRKRRFAQVKAS